MTLRHTGQGGFESNPSSLGGFVGNLLSNISWKERLENEELLQLKRPTGGVALRHNSNGSTCVIGEDRPDIWVRAIKVARTASEEGAEELLGQIRIAHAEIGGALELEVQIPQKWNRHGIVSLWIRLPRDLSIELVARNGRIDIEGVRCRVHARSHNGSVIVRNVIGDIDISTSNAKISCTDTCGNMVARSRDGKIELEKHLGSVDASTPNGLIHASLEEAGEAGVSLETTNGRIVLDLPKTIDADLDLRVDNGTIRNSLPLVRCTRETSSRLLGQIGAGGTPIKLRTTNGSIYLQ